MRGHKGAAGHARAWVWGKAGAAPHASPHIQSHSHTSIQVLFKFPFRVPAYYALILRSLTVLEGLALQADPQ